MLQKCLNPIPSNENPVPHLKIEKHPQTMAVVDSLLSVFVKNGEQTTLAEITILR